MKYTLLDLTQQVLSSIDGDEINSISDSTEAMQVVAIIRRCYSNLAPKMNYPEKKGLFGLTSSGDITKPTLMYFPVATFRTLEWMKYDCKKFGETDADFQPMEFLALDEFLTRMHAFAPSQDTSLVTFTITTNGQNVQFVVRNDKAPQVYTSLDDSTIVFDSYDAEVDSTLQSSKTLCYGEGALPWTPSDTFVIPFDDHQLLLNQAISWAWAELKQAQNAKAEREARDQLIATARDKQAVIGSKNYEIQLPHYGRKK